MPFRARLSYNLPSVISIHLLAPIVVAPPTYPLAATAAACNCGVPCLYQRQPHYQACSGNLEQ